MKYSWNDFEDEALDYLPWEDQIIYLRGIRKRMDYQTGIAGLTAPISYSWLSQLVEVRPRRGSRKPRPERLTKEALRAVFKRLEHAGLIRWLRHYEGRGLIFECLLADSDRRRQKKHDFPDTHQSVQNLNNPRTTPEQPQNSAPENGVVACLDGFEQPLNNPTGSSCSNPIPVSGIRKELLKPDFVDDSVDPLPCVVNKTSSHSCSFSSKNELAGGKKNDSPFETFWQAYPRKQNKKKTREIWRKKKLDPQAARLVADVKRRMAEDRGWRDGYIPLPSTYLSQERWEDEIQPMRPANRGLNGFEWPEDPAF